MFPNREDSALWEGMSAHEQRQHIRAAASEAAASRIKAPECLEDRLRRFGAIGQGLSLTGRQIEPERAGGAK
ncbi:hypothetical protein GCM10007148_28360 [Parvularcula lutaonensis]|nr:hypothetical protein GCM10007148_28360 [Parvularcula lutaonensis]